MKPLDRYHAKRSPSSTNEPFGELDTSAGALTESGAFVVHLHDATRRHYDIRLEMHGVLLSFAVPKGPSLDPSEKVLAVMTEDHPIEYVDFEDVIPDGQYGAGSMIVWDRGMVHYPEGPAEKELPTGRLHVDFRGMKLRGHYAFIKLAKGTNNEWLLFKKQDGEASTTRNIVEELPRSILSGLTVEELEHREAIAQRHVGRASKLGGKFKSGIANELLNVERSPLASIAEVSQRTSLAPIEPIISEKVSLTPIEPSPHTLREGAAPSSRSRSASKKASTSTPSAAPSDASSGLGAGKTSRAADASSLAPSDASSAPRASNPSQAGETPSLAPSEATSTLHAGKPSRAGNAPSRAPSETTSTLRAGKPSRAGNASSLAPSEAGEAPSLAPSEAASSPTRAGKPSRAGDASSLAPSEADGKPSRAGDASSLAPSEASFTLRAGATSLVDGDASLAPSEPSSALRAGKRARASKSLATGKANSAPPIEAGPHTLRAGVGPARVSSLPPPPGSVIYDADFDGVRVLAVRDGDVVGLRLWTDSPERIEAFYPDVVRALRALPVGSFAFDAELVAFDSSGHPSLGLLAQRVGRIAKGDGLKATTTTPVSLVVRDVLAVGDVDTRSIPLEKRRELVSTLVPTLGVLRAADPLEGDEHLVTSTCAQLGIASVVAKLKGSTYGDPNARWRRITTGLAPKSRSVVDHKATDTRAALRHVAITNRDKVFWPDEGYTKGDLIDYYAGIADTLLPYLKERPLILVRYPDGIEGKSFFQWNVPVGMPAWVRTLAMHELEEFRAHIEQGGTPSSKTSRPPRSSSHTPSSTPSSSKTPKRGFLVDDVATLSYVANLGCIPLHILASHAPDLTRADFFTIDFDIKQSEFRHAITLMKTLKRILDAIGLVGHPKTSGQSGLHVLVGLGEGHSFETACALADLLGRLLVEQHPDIATMDRVVSRRGDRVYVDTGQTGTSRAIVAPYSVRAVKGASVSTPLRWDEVEPGLDPKAFTIKTVPDRISKHGDLMKGLLGGPARDIMGAVAKLAELVPRSIRPT